jgi:hypothetical protein
MMEFFPSWTQLLGQVPTLLVYIVGIVLALVFWRRAPIPCGLTLLALGILLFTTLGQTFLTFYMIHSMRGAGNPESFGWMMFVIGIASAILRAGAVALLLAAVFVGRNVAVRPPPVDRGPGPG